MLQTSPDIYPLELALQPRQAATHCSYCAVQCAMELSETPLGTVEAKGLPHPVNAGKLCVLGQSSAALLNHTERLTQPLVRIGGDLTPVSWEAALGYAAAGFERVRTAHGPAANGVYSGASITNEKAYLLGKFARVALSTPNVDYNGRYCMSSAATAGPVRAAPPISATATAVVRIRRMVPLVVGISQATLTRRGQRSAMCSMIAVVEMAGVRSR